MVTKTSWFLPPDHSEPAVSVPSGARRFWRTGMFFCSVCSAASGSASDVTPMRWSNQQRPGPGLGPVRRAWSGRRKQRLRNRDDPQDRAVLVRDGDPEFWSPTHVRSGSAAGLGQPAELRGQLDVAGRDVLRRPGSERPAAGPVPREALPAARRAGRSPAGRGGVSEPVPTGALELLHDPEPRGRVRPRTDERNQGDGVHLRGDGGGFGPLHHSVLQPGQHDGVRLRRPAARRRRHRGGGGLALGRLLGPHPVRNLVQPEVHGRLGDELVNGPGRVHAQHHEPAQRRSRTAGHRDDHVHRLSLPRYFWFLRGEDLLEVHGAVPARWRLPEGAIRAQRPGVGPFQEEDQKKGPAPPCGQTRTHLPEQVSKLLPGGQAAWHRRHQGAPLQPDLHRPRWMQPALLRQRLQHACGEEHPALRVQVCLVLLRPLQALREHERHAHL